MTEFGTLDPDGTYTLGRLLSQSAILRCPNLIMLPSHYRADETCKCDDLFDRDMSSWGYRWDDATGLWAV